MEATQELQALDVLEIVETLKNAPRATAGAVRGPIVTRKALASNSSIAPVGLDLAPRRGGGDEEANPTMELRLPMRRRRLGGVVIAAIAGCALILVAAGIARVGHASSTPDPASSPPVTAAAVATTAAPPAVPGTSSPAATASPSPNDTASTGTVRLDKPAVAGHVWLDGKKLSSKSALVSCGTHQIRVGRGRTHSVDVPCGSEIGVSK
ncbi:MAG TPA: hypothetical protein VHS09_06415 [Polyangiaceae bacterium]|nr:hypothetical protein [Polyangiaceae bacterium]